jgi:small subunit ribosomal protein S8
MYTNDPIADLLTRIRNASMARHRYIELRASGMITALVKLLKERGFIEGFLEREAKPQSMIRVYLKYGAGRRPVIQGLRRISKGSCRRYVGYRNIPRVLGGLGFVILSTPQGVLDDVTARERKVGGELLCSVW